MSKITRIYTDKEVSAMDVCKQLLENFGYSLVIKDNLPTAHIHIPHISTRETEITKEDFGYEIRSTFFRMQRRF